MKYSKKKIANALTLMLSVLALINVFFHCSWNGTDTNTSTKYTLTAQSETEISISSNDFSVAHQSAKYEAVHQIPINTLQTEKLIRSSIFDFAIIQVLTHILTLLTLPAYLARLSPKWNPSIHIAHCRLVI